MEKATVGRIVHYVLANGEHRPAIVVEDWTKGQDINLQVFLDGNNDASAERHDGSAGAIFEHECIAGIAWRTSVRYADAKKKTPGTWHWPEIAKKSEETSEESEE